MSKKKRTFRQKIAKILISAFVLAVCIVPIFLTISFAYSIVRNHDPRHTVSLGTFHTRPDDQTTAQLTPFKQPLVSITFDDGWESVYTKAVPVLRQYGFHTTQYIITDDFDNPSYLSVAQLKSMQSAGEEIASHTVSHTDLTTLDATQLNFELSKSQATLQQDFGVSAKDFTSPYGAYNAYTLQTIGKYYRSQKNAEGDPAANPLEAINTAKGFDPLNFRSYSVRRTTTLADLQKLLDNAHTYNGWLVLTYHQVDNSQNEFSVSPDVFQQQVKLISQYHIRSASVGQVMDVLSQTGGSK